MAIILGIETSCDETSAAVYDSDTHTILSNVTFSQIDQHKHFGGVVPEIASRSQLEKITPIVKEAIAQANSSLEKINAIAVTKTPGLPGSLLVGVCFAKTLAFGKNKPIIGINHLEAHAFSPLLEHEVNYPHICLTASGGHTSLYLIKSLGEYKLLGQTLDDAAGEAFDKIAKMLDLSYPGGPIIEQLAREVDFEDFYNYPRGNRSGRKETLDFSFSGLKTAVLYDLVDKNAYDMQEKKLLVAHDLELKKRVSSSLLVCITDIFKRKLELAIKQYPELKAITMAGGVACNKYIKSQLTKLCEKKGLKLFVPSPKYCTDNAAMVAFVGAYKFAQNKFDTFELDIFD